jgi:hypothetical protein
VEYNQQWAIYNLNVRIVNRLPVGRLIVSC